VARLREKSNATLFGQIKNKLRALIQAIDGNLRIPNMFSSLPENCLLSKLPDIYSPGVVAEMSDETIEKLAKESDEVKQKRKRFLNSKTRVRCSEWGWHELLCKFTELEVDNTKTMKQA
jgi:hypothetical protein